ncbi:polar amino acid transport system permease protein [Angulomicrobium tetraedrale]|uniref:Polar amino acid transport system permease protein n=1 Tax=Ancylobacter tetraedralis TaxID=217068 RepID=A0A839ZFL0_9HYPH|nr:amino acid ABC transporter permease [Ancylobacter tetraedralis]MBB3773426.1 polar amino acid transport system permease protein [Ancylobacter tetraedralis]
MTLDAVLLIASGIPLTLAVTAGAFALGAVLGIPLCALRVSRSSTLHLAAVAIIMLLRSIPPIVWLFLLYFGIGSGFLRVGPVEASVAALGLITAANMAEIYRGALRGVHSGQWEASTALGMKPWARFRDVLAPQICRMALPSSVTFFIGLLKDSAIASTIGVGEIAFQANYISRRTFEGLEVFAVAGLVYILISLPIAAMSRQLDSRLRERVAQ